MINPAKILSLPAGERDDELLKLISEYFPEILPKLWKHGWYGGTYSAPECRKCGETKGDIDTNKSCPTPEPGALTFFRPAMGLSLTACHISLGWNLAKKMQAECDETIYEEALFQVWKTTVNKGNFHLWCLSAQPHHYLLAALIAKDKSDD